MSILQFRLVGYQFRPTWLGTLIMILLIPVFIKLGLWQYHKAEQKQALQDQYDRYRDTPPQTLPTHLDDPEMWRYRRVKVSGIYDASHQIYIDNQVYGEQAGYHVLTPMAIEGNKFLLVNRGWIAGSADHHVLPNAEVPSGLQTITGVVWIPPVKVYSLESQASQSNEQPWMPVWQNLDMARYAQAVNKTILPVVIRLDKEIPQGYVRDWPRPAERITTHIGYAYQWFGFAIATVFIYLFVSFRKNSA
jgi:surfeit locus 1 family protein